MNVLQRQMFQQGGPTSPRDIIIAERRKRGLPIRDGIMLNPELINQVRQLQAGQSIAEIFGEVQQSAPAPDITIQEQPQQAPSEMLDIGSVLESAVPSVDRRKLIEYYLSIGLNPADILEKFPAATTQMIEEVAQQKGGVINPGVRGPETFEGGPENVFIDETVLVEGRQPRQKPPIDPIREELISLDIPKLTPTIETGLPDSDLNDLETAVAEGQVTRQTNLGPNEYKASDGTIYQIDPAKFEQSLSSESSRILGGILMNPNVEYGSNLASIIENTARARSSTLVPEGSIQVGQPIQGLSAADVIQSGAKFGIDVGKEGIESVFNILRAPFTDPTIAGILGSREREKRLRESGVGDRVNLFETGLDDLNLTNPLSASQTLLTGGFDEYFKTGGEKPEVLDSIILESSTGTVDQKKDDTQKEIEELQKTPAQDSTEVVTAEETVTETPEEESPAEGEAVAEAATTETGADAVGAAGEKTAEQAREEDPLISGNPFTSKEFINFARGLSKGLAEEEEFDKGLATGAALAAEQRSVDDLESQKLDTELKIELAKLQDKGDLKLSEAKSVYDLNNTANTSAQSFQNSTATVALIKELENILKNENPTAISGFASRILERAAVALNSDVTKDKEDFKKLSATERAKKLSTLISQANIREILGESGRTISNFDRQIVEQLSTSIDLGAPAASNLVALANVDSRIKNNMQTQLDEIRSARQALNLAGFDLIGENALKTIEFGFGLLDDSGVVFEEDDVLLDYRNEFSKLLD